MTLEHRDKKRAEWAYETVKRLKESGTGEKKLKELKADLRKLPSHIQTSGLAQTLLFYGKDDPQGVAAALCKHLGLDGRGIAEAVRDLVRDPSRFRQKTREAMDAAQWLKRFAEVLLQS